MRTAFALPLLLASLAPAQSVLIRVQQDSAIGQVPNGGTVSVNATGVNQPRLLTITVTYIGTTSLRLSQEPQILGSPAFSVTSPPSAVALAPNQSLNLQVRFLPVTTQSSQAQLDLPFQEAAPPAPPAADNATPVANPPKPGLIVLGFNGTVPEYALNYGLAVDGNIVNLPAGGVLPFFDTVVNSSGAATMVLVNRGSGPGQILSVSITGEAFSLAGLPLIPATLPPGGTLPFQVRYRPRQPGNDSGSLTLNFEGGSAYTVSLRGSGIGSFLFYELLPPDGAVQPMVPSQAVVLPATPVGDKTTSFVRIRNTTSLDISVNAIAIAGAGFQLANLPFLPLTMPPGDVQLFSIIFTPAQAGRQSGRLRVGGDSFDVVADGLGPLLTYSYRSPAGVVAVAPLGTVLVPGTQVGKSEVIEFTLRNTGTTPAPVMSVAIVADGRSAFDLVGLPVLPIAIAPGASATFGIRFSPLTSGLSTASLRIGSEAFPLSGLGSQPEPLPDYTIQGPSAVQAFEQLPVSLSLVSPYSVAVTGTLTISTESDSFSGDPSVLFVSGGKVAAFTIPAGATRAVFANGSNEIRFQTGTVAGSILFTPAFASTGGQTLTPDNPKQHRAVLAPAAPRLAGLSIDARTTTGFTIQAIGHATTRTITKITVSVKGKPGFNFPATEFTQDLTANSFLWFNSPAAAGFGGQFVIQFPVSLRSSDTSSAAVPPIQAIESVTVTLTNERGTSNALTAPVQ